MGFPQYPFPYLLFKAVWGQEEAMQGYKVAFQEPHEQHQVHPICKLWGESQVTLLSPNLPAKPHRPHASHSKAASQEDYWWDQGPVV
jgi:hypothetical protein